MDFSNGVICMWQSAQILAKPDLAPLAWVKRLVVLCDRAPQTPLATVLKVLEQELGRSVEDVFERFETEPLGSASIAQVLIDQAILGLVSESR